MEHENLTGDVKGKGASGSNCETESTDAPERGGPPRSSDEAGVMLVERRGRVIDIGSGQLRSGNRPQEEILCRRGGGTVSVLTPPPKA
jgi:hypothetical protein